MDTLNIRKVEQYRGLILHMAVFQIDVDDELPGHQSWGYRVVVGEPANAESTYLFGPYCQSSPYPSSAEAHTACLQRGHLAVDLLLGTI